MRIRVLPVLGVTIFISFLVARATAQPIAGPLRVHPQNRRYFTDDSQRASLLAGSHTWTLNQR